MPTFSVSFKAMGSRIRAWLSTPTQDDARILEQMPGWFEEWEAHLSRFRPTSELSFLNRHAGLWVRVSETMVQVIDRALDAARLTDGLVNPLILPALEAAGYDHSFEPEHFQPGPAMPVSPVTDWRAIGLDAGHALVWLPAGTRLDLGGIAKGWAAQQAANRLAAVGPCLVDAGGDMVARGAPEPGMCDGWAVALAGPQGEEDDASGVIILSDAALATSGTDYRRWQRNGKTLHHLIDPRTGQSATTRASSATVIAVDAVHAEAWAKVALIEGTLPPAPAVLTLDDGTRLVSPDFATYWRKDPCTENR